MGETTEATKKNSVSDYPNLQPWQPGQSGNPAGRGKGVRNKLTEQFLEALYEDFQEFGKEAICMVREEKTDVYLQIIAKLVPKEMHIKIDPLEEMTSEQLIATAVFELAKCPEILAHFGGITDNAVGESIEISKEPEPVRKLPAIPKAKGVSS